MQTILLIHLSVWHGFSVMTAELINPRGRVASAMGMPVGTRSMWRARVLLVDDSPSLSRTYADQLSRASIDTRCVNTAAEAREAIRRDAPQVLLLDLDLPGGKADEVMRLALEQPDPIGVVVLTSNGSINAAVRAMRDGAHDYVIKPASRARLTEAVITTLDRVKLESAAATAAPGKERARYYGFIGSSEPMQAVYAAIDSIAASKATIFVTGESGTGKEVFADAVHRHSGRCKHPFIALNCGAIPRELMESEIFGHVKGAFTGAISERQGAAAMADGGTLFLDEVCELDAALQSKLLRFLQSGAFQKVGGNQLETVDIRIICATNRNPQEEVAAGRFREDLFYRLHVVPVHMPPLRERRGDIGEIAQHLLTQYAGEEGRDFKRFDAGALAALQAYDWPGNVRELQNVVRHVVVLNQGPEATVAMLPPPVGTTEAALQAAAGDSRVNGEVRPLWQVERDAIEHAIAACGGNISKAAAMLEISASTIYRKKQAWEAC